MYLVFLQRKLFWFTSLQTENTNKYKYDYIMLLFWTLSSEIDTNIVNAVPEQIKTADLWQGLSAVLDMQGIWHLGPPWDQDRNDKFRHSRMFSYSPLYSSRIQLTEKMTILDWQACHSSIPYSIQKHTIPLLFISIWG